MTKIYCDISTCIYCTDGVCANGEINLIEDEFGELVCVDFMRRYEILKKKY